MTPPPSTAAPDYDLKQLDATLDPADYLVRPKEKVDVRERSTRYDGPIDKHEGRKALAALSTRLAQLQERLYAEGSRSLLVVLQAMDAAGKDSTVRHVFGPVNPEGCRVTSFKAPSKEELAHDYLWRVHAHTPADGHIAVFNRSHYEDVLIVKVKGWAPAKRIEKRYGHINAFEKMLTDEGTVVVKFMIHISKDYQKQRLQRRLDRPDKHWKFNPEDLTERAHWDEYMQVFNDALRRCSTAACPWYVVPGERRWFRNLLIAKVLVDRLEAMDLRLPPVNFDPSEIVIE
ncbi:MAG: polyphosphate kinase 2 family protein [Planctomycetota bacterium]